MRHLADRRRGRRATAALVIAAAVLVWGAASCANLKASRPLVPMREYERMLVGSMFADYVGNDKCLEACHAHDRVAAFLADSVHGQQVAEGSDLPLVNCETCHGPGSEAIDPGFIQKNARCDTSQFIKPGELPPAALSMLCLKCHSSYSMAAMQAWPYSDHAMNDISCSDCHKLHLSSRQKLEGAEINQLCQGCHDEIKIRFSYRSRHPVPEGIMLCVDCHEPHGSQMEYGLKALDQKGLCINCHGRLAGPYTFEHADVTDECTGCHQPHGSIFDDMLVYQEPYLCLQCHTGHTDFLDPSNPSAGVKQAFYTRCTNCHTQVHGTDTRGPHPGSGLIQ